MVADNSSHARLAVSLVDAEHDLAHIGRGSHEREDDRDALQVLACLDEGALIEGEDAKVDFPRGRSERRLIRQLEGDDRLRFLWQGRDPGREGGDRVDSDVDPVVLACTGIRVRTRR